MPNSHNFSDSDGEPICCPVSYDELTTDNASFAIVGAGAGHRYELYTWEIVDALIKDNFVSPICQGPIVDRMPIKGLTDDQKHRLLTAYRIFDNDVDRQQVIPCILDPDSLRSPLWQDLRSIQPKLPHQTALAVLAVPFFLVLSVAAVAATAAAPAAVVAAAPAAAPAGIVVLTALALALAAAAAAMTAGVLALEAAEAAGTVTVRTAVTLVAAAVVALAVLFVAPAVALAPPLAGALATLITLGALEEKSALAVGILVTVEALILVVTHVAEKEESTLLLAVPSVLLPLALALGREAAKTVEEEAEAEVARIALLLEKLATAVAEQKDAATRIQSFFRGYKTRKALYKVKKSAAQLAPEPEPQLKETLAPGR